MVVDLGCLYEEEFKRDGDKSKLLWSRNGRAEKSYVATCTEINFKEKTILDVGCGFGGFYGFLVKEKQVPMRYVGIDTKKAFVDIAKERHGETDSCRFQCNGIESETWKYDYAVGIGTLVTKDIFHVLINAMWKIAKKGIAFNCLSTVDYKGKLVCYSPLAVLEKCFKLSNHIVMRHDYGEQEATFFVFKNKEKGMR